jgi:threonine dehydratase
LEHLQHTGSFKCRGAFNSLLDNGMASQGVVAASGGNHGAAVAYAAQKLGIKSHIFVPELSGKTKIELIKKTGSNLTIVPGAYADALEAANKYQAETNAISVHAYDTAETVVGQGTLFCEWEQQGLQADTLIIAVGGGGLISGAISWFGKTKKIVAVEPEKCPTLNVALENGKPTGVSVSGVAANALGAKLIGNICFNLSVQNEIESVLVSDSEIVEAQKLLWEKHRMLVEPAGAAALAAIISGKYQHSPNEKLAILICGANPTVAPEF